MALVGSAVLLTACGEGNERGSVAAPVGPVEGQDYAIASATCDPLRGDGTITNRAGEPAAFRITVNYQYSSGDRRPLQMDTTPVLADGESFDFSIGPDPTGGTPASCRIIGAKRVEADAQATRSVITREQGCPGCREQ